MWEDDFGTEEQLEDHLREEHAMDLEPICQHMLRRNAPDALHSVYCQAIAAKCRGQPPIAGSSLDRTALHSLAEATAGNNVEALICCSCGGIHPYVAEVAEKGDINWYQPLQRSDSTGELFFLGQPLTAIIGVLGLQSYLSKYNLVAPGQVALTAHESFHEWCLKLPGLVNGDLLCCPEDRKLPLHRHRTTATRSQPQSSHRPCIRYFRLKYSISQKRHAATRRTGAAASPTVMTKHFVSTAGCPSARTASRTCRRPCSRRSAMRTICGQAMGWKGATGKT